MILPLLNGRLVGSTYTPESHIGTGPDINTGGTSVATGIQAPTIRLTNAPSTMTAMKITQMAKSRSAPNLTVEIKLGHQPAIKCFANSFERRYILPLPSLNWYRAQTGCSRTS